MYVVQRISHPNYPPAVGSVVSEGAKTYVIHSCTIDPETGAVTESAISHRWKKDHVVVIGKTELAVIAEAWRVQNEFAKRIHAIEADRDAAVGAVLSRIAAKIAYKSWEAS